MHLAKLTLELGSFPECSQKIDLNNRVRARKYALYQGRTLDDRKKNFITVHAIFVKYSVSVVTTYSFYGTVLSIHLRSNFAGFKFLLALTC